MSASDSFEDQWVDAILKDRKDVNLSPARVEQIRSPVERLYSRGIADDVVLNWEVTERIVSLWDTEEAGISGVPYPDVTFPLAHRRTISGT